MGCKSSVLRGLIARRINICLQIEARGFAVLITLVNDVKGSLIWHHKSFERLTPH